MLRKNTYNNTIAFDSTVGGYISAINFLKSKYSFIDVVKTYEEMKEILSISNHIFRNKNKTKKWSESEEKLFNKWGIKIT